MIEKALPDVMCGICSYIADLRSFACVARGIVTGTHWQNRADQLWPGAATLLFGAPTFQVRALLARPSGVEEPLGWIDPNGLTARHEDNYVLLELKQGNLPLWRSVGQIVVRRPDYNFHGHTTEEIASFHPPSEIGVALESAVMSWWRQAGESWPPNWSPYRLCDLHSIADLAQELTVWLQVCYKIDTTPRVVRPCLHLSHVVWEDMSDNESACMELLFCQGFESYRWDRWPVGRYGSIEFYSSLWRTMFSISGMDGPLKVTMEFKGDVDEHQSFLISGYLSKLKCVGS